ncbi:MAG: anaerobic ribonucleoside-triphosphate reductase [Bacillota bacterium]
MQVTCTFEKEFDEFYYGLNKKFLELEGISKRKIDVGAMSHDYFTHKISDISIDANANIDDEKTPNNYVMEITKGLLKLEGYYLLWRYAKKRFGIERANELLRSIIEGDVYFHDASSVKLQMPYCLAFSTAPLMHEGRKYGQLHSLPPKRADSFMAQVIETTMDLSQQFAGAVAPADLIINFAWYATRDGISDYEALQQFQKFVHVVNNKFRLGCDSPFTNISLFDRPNLEAVWRDYVYPDGSRPDLDYVMHLQKLFGEWFAEGDPASSLPYRFPVCTVNIMVKDGAIQDGDFLAWVAKNNIKKACFNIYVNDGQKIASCCRVCNNLEEMRLKRADTFGNGGVNVGSHRVVTVNLPRIARRAKGNRKLFYSLLEDVLCKARDLLLVHREEILERRIRQGFLRFFRPLNWFNQGMFFSTIGIVGVYEAVKFMGLDIVTPDGLSFAEELLKTIDSCADCFTQETGWAFNVEQVPGETAAVTLAKKDEARFGSNPYELYSNQYVPLIEDVDTLTRVMVNGKLLDLTSGGGILHLNVADPIKNAVQMKKLIETCVKSGASHFAINYGYIVCHSCGGAVVGGNRSACPGCGGTDIDYLTRVVGYYSRVSAWHPVRRNYEFPRRIFG